MLKITALSNGIDIAGISFPNNSLSFEISSGTIINIYLVVNKKKIFSSYYLDFLNSSDQQYASPQAVIDELLTNNNQPTGGGGGGTAATTTFAPNGDISATNVQTAIVEVRNDTDTKLSGKQDSLGFTPENITNKSTSVVADQTSNTKYSSVKSVYDWAVGLGVTNLNNQRLGTVFTDLFTSSSNYTQTQTSGSQTFNSGFVTMTGGNNSTLTNKMMYNYNGTGTLLDDHIVSLRCISTVNAGTSYGPGVGMQINPIEDNSYAVFLNTSAGGSRGRIALINPLNNAVLATSTLAISFTNSTDTIELSFRYAVNKVIATAKNITTPTQTVSSVVIPNIVTLEFEWSPTSATTPARVARPTVYTFGGTQNLYSLSMESDLIQNPMFTLIGDSRAFGLGCTSFRSCYANLTGIRGGIKSMVWARGGATATSLLANISELGNFFKGGHKGYVMIAIGVNDAIAGRTLAQFQADYSSLIQAIQAFGGVPLVTKIANVTSSYVNQAVINPLINSYNTWILTLPFKQVDENTSLNSGVTLNANYTTDGIHLIDVGMSVEANALNSQLATLNILYPTLTYTGSAGNFTLPQAMRIIGGATIPGTVTQGTVISGETTGQNATGTFGVSDVARATIFQWCQNPTNYAQLAHYNSSFAGNHTGTSIANAASSEFQNTSGGTIGGKVVTSAAGTFLLSGSTSTNAGIGITTAGVKVSSIANSHTAATSTLQIAGSFAAGYVAKTANYTLTIDDRLVNCTANSFTITLPTAVGIAGREYIIKNSGTATVITVATTSSQTIDGAAPTTITNMVPMRVMSDGANWITY